MKVDTNELSNITLGDLATATTKIPLVAANIVCNILLIATRISSAATQAASDEIKKLSKWAHGSFGSLF